MMLHRILFIASTLICQVSWSIVCTVDWKTSSPAMLQTYQPPCPFNALCTCSNPGPNLGLVQCLDAPFESLPNLNSSKVFTLRLENNGLRVLDDGRFADTGMWRLQIRHNPITRVPAGAFDGLEYSLSELDLRRNRLHFFPTDAVRQLVRLKEIDLTGNDIASVQRSDFQGLERSLTKLVLRCNALTHLEQDLFGDLSALQWLDLSENRLTFVADTIFHSGSSRLRHFNLAENALTVIPYGALALLKSLRSVDLSRNRIVSVPMLTDSKDGIDSTVSAALLQMNGALRLKLMNLNENRIETLSPRSFRYFESVDRLSLAANPLRTIADDAFFGTAIEQLDLRACDIQSLSTNAFNGLANMLRLVDLAHNLLDGSSISDSLVNMTALMNVSMEGNIRSYFNLSTLYNSRQTLKELHVESIAGGNEDRSKNLGFDVDFAALEDFHQLRILGLSHFPSTSLQEDLFKSRSPTIETMVLRGCNLKTMTADPFTQVSRLKRLDISSNHLIRMNKNVFRTVGRSLETLIMGDALVIGIVGLPDDRLFEYLENLKHLDLSNNRLTHIPSSAFDRLTSLKYLNLQDNILTSLSNTTFTANRQLGGLTHLRMSFNRIRQLHSNTFRQLNDLRHVYLDDNDIGSIDAGAFVDLKRLEYLDLRGNIIESIARYAFQHLPSLGYLNLAWNHLETFPLDAFDQVGTLATMKVDLSHNRLKRLAAANVINGSGIVNIKWLDLRHNNISVIDSDYFEPIKDSIMELHLSDNSLPNVSSPMFDDLPQLRVLRLDNNLIDDIEPDAFHKTTLLQSLVLRHNRLMSLPSSLLAGHASLQLLDVSNNRLRELTEDALAGTPLMQRLVLSHNHISHFPEAALRSVASSLRHLDLSHNQLRYLPKDVLGNSLVHLHTLLLANNKLKNIEDGILCLTSVLQVLDLSGNPLGNPVQTIIVTRNVSAMPQLEDMNLSNASLTTIPDLDFPNVMRMNLSHNSIDFLNQESFRTAQELRHLDLSHNRLKTVPIRVWPMVPRLSSLNLASNPFLDLMNESFLGLNVLDQIDLQGFGTPRTVQSGLFVPIKNLRRLHISPYTRTGFDLVRSMSYIDNLRTLDVYLGTDEGEASTLFALRSTTSSSLPPTLTTITIRGVGFQGIVDGSLDQTLRNRNLHLTITNATINSLELDERRLQGVRNLWLYVSFNDLVALSDPSSSDDATGRGLLLRQLSLQGNRWQCNCDIGWVELWMRRFRQTLCQKVPPQSGSSTGDNLDHDDDDGDDGGADDPSVYRQCQDVLEGLHQVRCYNLGNRTLLDVLKHDLECYFKSTSSYMDSSHISNAGVGIFTVLAILTRVFLTQFFVG